MQSFMGDREGEGGGVEGFVEKTDLDGTPEDNNASFVVTASNHLHHKCHEWHGQKGGATPPPWG